MKQPAFLPMVLDFKNNRSFMRTVNIEEFFQQKTRVLAPGEIVLMKAVNDNAPRSQ